MQRAHEPPARFPEVVGAGRLAAPNGGAVVRRATILSSVLLRRKRRRKAPATGSCPEFGGPLARYVTSSGEILCGIHVHAGVRGAVRVCCGGKMSTDRLGSPGELVDRSFVINGIFLAEK
jgi:hypothetical protein